KVSCFCKKLCIFICMHAENVTEVRGELGTNVTLTCSNQTSEIHWYMEIYSQFRAGIGRSFSSAGSTYYSPGFETKFSILGNKLVIKNFRTEDCRLYFCGIKRGGSIHFANLTVLQQYLTDQHLEQLQHKVLIMIAVLILVLVCCSSQSVRTSFIRCEVVLPCIYSERLSESVNTFWRDKDDKVVLDINSREDKMDPKLTGHVFSFPDQYKTGNLSIIIKDLRADAAGQYECDIPKVSCQTKMTLKVTAFLQTNSDSSVLFNDPLSSFSFSVAAMLFPPCVYENKSTANAGFSHILS
uniref:Ig-like domain-containing protein n=1 Tax=Maylandia zebra TaxID=106582 RepID=A0A3P9C9A4_9CICH